VRSSGQYVWRSAHAIVQAFVLYRPFRFFFLLGLVPFLVGVALYGRWVLLWMFEDEYRSRIPSLLAASLFVLVAVQVWALAFLSDLQAASRRIQSDVRLRQRRNELDASR
jgi:uncharacterized membrane protein YqjE